MQLENKLNEDSRLKEPYIIRWFDFLIKENIMKKEKKTQKAEQTHKQKPD